MDDESEKNISKLLYTKDTTRVYELSSGEFEERSGGTASWRHNSPGNLKMEYANSVDTVHGRNQAKDQVLHRAQASYNGVIDLDQHGNLIFGSVEQGRAAQLEVIDRLGKGKTVAQMLGHYSTADYSGPTHYDAQESMIYKTGDAAGFDLRTKLVSNMTPEEKSALADGISKFEGWHEGKTSTLTAQQVADLQAGKQIANENTQDHPGLLKQGMRGDAVKHAQQELHDLGYLQANPNGRFGPQPRRQPRTSNVLRD